MEKYGGVRPMPKIQLVNTKIVEPKRTTLNKNNIRVKEENLTKEEKLLRRKLSNRAAAQISRDKKKAYTRKLEEELKKLKEESCGKMEETNLLKKQIERLKLENQHLNKQNIELRAILASPLPLSPTSSEDITEDENEDEMKGQGTENINNHVMVMVVEAHDSFIKKEPDEHIVPV